MHTGWFKFHRQMFDNPICTKDSEYFFVWMWILNEASYEEGRRFCFKNNVITLQKGQLLTTTIEISETLKINRSKVVRILKKLESEHQIEQQTSNRNTLISVVNWEKYQSSEQQIEQPVNNNRTTSEQQSNNNRTTNGKPSYYIKKERIKEGENERTKEGENNIYDTPRKKSSKFVPPTVEEVKKYCTERRNSVDAEAFVDFYTANGWVQARGKPIKDWKACVRTWEKNNKNAYKNRNNNKQSEFDKLMAQIREDENDNSRSQKSDISYDGSIF